MAAIFNFTGNLSGRLARIPEPETVPADGYYTKIETDAAIEAAIAAVVGGAPAVLDTLKEIADVIGTETGSGAAGILKRVADLESGKADKAEMSITPVVGSLDKTTIQLKSGTSATVLTAHQDISGKVDKNATTVMAGLAASATGDGAVAVGPVRANGQGAGASAEGHTSVALGYWSRATAFGAVQVGHGVNSTQNSFQFRTANLFVELDGAVRLGAGFPAATTTAPGSMSAADKAKLNGIAAGATAVTIDSALSQTSENPVQNKVVAKALYTGFTEWVCDEISDGYEYRACEWTADTQGIGWYVTIRDQTSHRAVMWYAGGAVDDVGLETPSTDPVQIRLSRHLITPTKTSQLTNDSGFVPARFVLGKLDGVAAYPAWVSGNYATGDIRSFSGRLYRLTGPIIDQTTPPPNAPWWEVITIQSLLAAKANSADVNAALAGKVATNALASLTYDFSTNVGLYTAVRDLIQALGGSVTNFPAINGGN